MFTIDWDQTSTLSRDKIIPKIVDQYFKSNVLMYKLRPKAKVVPGSRSIVVPLSFAPSAGGMWWAGTDKLDLRIRNEITAAQYFWKNYVLPVTISQDEEDTIDGPEALMSLVEAKMQIAERTLMHDIGGALGIYNDGSNPKALTGLQYALKAYTGTTAPTYTYAGIPASPTLNTWWLHKGDGTSMATSTDGTGTYLFGTKFGVWDKMFSSQALDSGRSSDTVLCNHGVFNELRLMVHDKTTWFRPQQNDELVKAGFQTMQYAGKDIVVDEFVPRNATTKVESVFFLDTSRMDLYVHQKRNFAFDGWKPGFDQMIRLARFFFRGEIVFSEKRTSGVHSNVDTTATSP